MQRQALEGYIVRAPKYLKKNVVKIHALLRLVMPIEQQFFPRIQIYSYSIWMLSGELRV